MHVLRQALRQLARRRSATLLSVGLLALGVGLAASFYSVLDSALLSGLPVQDGDRLVAFSTRDAAGWPMPLEDYRAIAEAQRSFEWTAPLRTFNFMVTRGDGTKGVVGSYVAAELFSRLGARPLLGRGFDAVDEDPSNPPVALISYRLWVGSYGGDPGVIGEQIVINREPTVIVGVMPEAFHFPLRHDVWGALRTEGREWAASMVFGVAKLADGVDVKAAKLDLARISSSLDEHVPQPGQRFAELEPFVRAHIGDRARAALRTMVFASLGLLLLTCANLANLRLSETLRRQRELDTRLALGSGPGGLVAMLLIENLIVGLAGTVLALAFAWLVTTTLGRALLAGGTLERIYWIDPGLDLTSARLVAAAALGASVLGALAPIVSTLVGAHRPISGTGRTPARTSVWARGLVGVQVALCFALLVIAGLFASRASNLLSDDLGIHPSRLSSIRFSTYQIEPEGAEPQRELLRRFRTELEAEPEVVAAALSSRSPWGPARRHPIGIETEPEPELAPTAEIYRISPGFFETLGLEHLSGRELEPADFGGAGELASPVQVEEGAPRDTVAIVSRRLADRLAGTEPLGRMLIIGGRRAGDPPLRARIVGVVADLGIDRSDLSDRDLSVYLPDRSDDAASFALVRVAAGAAGARPVLERVLSRIAPRVATFDEVSAEQALAASIWIERRLAQIFSIFGIAALVLAAVGMYAVIAVMVRSRRHELGIRAAIGARPSDLKKLVLGESGRQLLFGLVVGSGALWAARRVIDEVLLDALSWQPSVLVTVAGLVVLCCVFASWGPTARAARTDPTDCLRAE